jgi:hypothetical protein
LNLTSERKDRETMAKEGSAKLFLSGATTEIVVSREYYV